MMNYILILSEIKFALHAAGLIWDIKSGNYLCNLI